MFPIFSALFQTHRGSPGRVSGRSGVSPPRLLTLRLPALRLPPPWVLHSCPRHSVLLSPEPAAVLSLSTSLPSLVPGPAGHTLPLPASCLISSLSCLLCISFLFYLQTEGQEDGRLTGLHRQLWAFGCLLPVTPMP